MKKAFLWSIMLSVLVIVTSCKKDEDNKKDENGNDPKSSVSVKIDGVQWTTDNVMAVYTEAANVLQITATGTQLTDYLYVKTLGYQAGTYPLSEMENNCTYTVYSSYLDGEGEIVITSSDAEKKLVSGTFHFTGINTTTLSDSKVFTEGKFENIKYIVY